MLRSYQLTSLVIVFIVFPVLLSEGTSHGVEERKGEEEFCERENFEASCSADGEVILIRSAVFGRMNIGKCLKNGYGVLGCSTNVLEKVETKCSGRQRCQFPVGDLHNSRPCPAELISFLKVRYDCVKVTVCQEHSCASGKPLRITTSEGYLASAYATSSGCGSDSCQWVLEANPGQRFNLTFRSFVPVRTDAEHQKQQRQQQQQQRQLIGRFCQRLATVVERSSMVSKDVTLCDNDASVVQMMTSTHEEVKLKLYQGTPENPAYFIVHYQVVGCADPEVPKGASMKRSGDSATVVCHGKPTTWHLTCNGFSWSGELGLCQNSYPHDVTPNWSVQSAMEKAGATTEGILVVVGLGIVIGIIVGCFLLGVVVVIIKRKRRKQALQYERRLELLTHYSTGVASDVSAKAYYAKSDAADVQQVGQSLMYDSGLGTYEAHGYTSPLPEGVPTNFGQQPNGNVLETTTNCAIHGDHMYESSKYTTKAQ